mgnify:CR=1 FL=1
MNVKQGITRFSVLLDKFNHGTKVGIFGYNNHRDDYYDKKEKEEKETKTKIK